MQPQQPNPQQTQPGAPMSTSQGTVQNFQPPKASNSKLWIWLVAIGIPVIIGIGVVVYLLIPKGSPTAWCDTQYKMTQALQTMSISTGSTSDKKAALAKAKDYVKQLQSAAPSEIKKDIDIYAGYTTRFIDAYEKTIDNQDDMSIAAGAAAAKQLPTPTAEEDAANTNLMNYTKKTCTSDGKVAN
jgi:hypothetical protein